VELWHGDVKFRSERGPIRWAIEMFVSAQPSLNQAQGVGWSFERLEKIAGGVSEEEFALLGVLGEAWCQRHALSAALS
jgi:hypothetical protein